MTKLKVKKSLVLKYSLIQLVPFGPQFERVTFSDLELRTYKYCYHIIKNSKTKNPINI